MDYISVNSIRFRYLINLDVNIKLSNIKEVIFYLFK